MTSTDRWNPPRGAVHIVQAVNGHQAICDACTWITTSGLKTIAEEQKRWHKCPAGTVDALPTCPRCGVTGKHCKDSSAYNTPSGPFGTWHTERWRIYSSATGIDAEPKGRPL